MRYEQYNRAVMKDVLKEKTVSMTQEPKWIDPQEYSKKVLDNMPKWTEPRSPIEVDIVLRPKHYGGKDNPHEVFKVLEAWDLDFHLGNVVKYVARAGKKDKSKEIQDLEKALWYLKRKIEVLKGEK